MDLISALTYFLHEYSQVIAFTLIFLSSPLLFISGYRTSAALFAAISFLIAFTSAMATFSPVQSPITESLPGGGVKIYTPIRWWAKAQAYTYLWGVVSMSVVFLAFSVQLYRRSAGLAEPHKKKRYSDASGADA